MRLSLRSLRVLDYSFFMRYMLGFDGGGTKTDCVLMDETGAVVARSRSGPSNPTRVGTDLAIAALVEAAERAITASGRAACEIVAISGAVGGVGVSGAAPEFIRRLKLKFPSASVTINTDLAVALAATGERPGIVVIAGTGSAVFGRNAAGNTARDGGFGPVLGDPGSAYDIGRKVLLAEWRRVLSGEESYLRNEILELFKCNWVELQERIRANPDSILPKIFPLVANAANKSDDPSRALLRASAEELVGLVRGVVERLDLVNEPFFLAKTGGVFNRTPHFDDYFDQGVRRVAPKARIGPLPEPLEEFCARSARDCLDRPVREVGS